MGALTELDLSALWVTIRLAVMTLAVLLIGGTPLASGGWLIPALD